MVAGAVCTTRGRIRIRRTRTPKKVTPFDWSEEFADFIKCFPRYDVEAILRMTVRNYYAMRRHVPRLQYRDLANGIRAAYYAQTKQPHDIINVFDPPKKREA